MNRVTPIPDSVTLHVPFRIVKRGGRKEMQLPAGAHLPRQADSALVKALARAFRWKRVLESGEFATIAELAQREGIAVSYLTRVLRLTLHAPDIVEAILDGTQLGAQCVEIRDQRPDRALRLGQDLLRNLVPGRPHSRDTRRDVTLRTLSDSIGEHTRFYRLAFRDHDAPSNQRAGAARLVKPALRSRARRQRAVQS